MAEKPKVISIANQKGGVGKTTTAINLSAAIAARGNNVALIDLDPQGNASTGLGITQKDRENTTYDLLLSGASLKDCLLETSVPNLQVCSANSDLSSADLELMNAARRIFLLQDALTTEDVPELNLDYIVIDCPPSLNLLTLNALVASNSLLVPLQSEFFALEGLSQLLRSVQEIRESANPSLRIEGVLLTMYDKRNNLSIQVAQDARENLKELVFKTMIPRNVRLSEAPSFGMSVIDYDPVSRGAVAYKALATEILAREQ